MSEEHTELALMNPRYTKGHKNNPLIGKYGFSWVVPSVQFTVRSPQSVSFARLRMQSSLGSCCRGPKHRLAHYSPGEGHSFGCPAGTRSLIKHAVLALDAPCLYDFPVRLVVLMFLFYTGYRCIGSSVSDRYQSREIGK